MNVHTLIMIGLVVCALLGGVAYADRVSEDLNQLSGVYKVQVKIGEARSMTREAVDNTLEIVPIDQDTAYIRAGLYFMNYDLCKIYGMARREGSALVLHQQFDENGPECTLKLKVDDQRITFADENSACQVATCGHRGYYDGIVFPRERRRDIRYMKLLLNSEEYKTSVAGYLAAKEQ